jgi:hypothetical protein
MNTNEKEIGMRIGKKLNTMLKVVAVATACMSPVAMAQQTDAAAMVPLQDYILAHETGKPEYVNKAFSGDAKITGYRDGRLVTLSVEQYAARFSGVPAPDEAQRRRSVEILDLTVDAAIAKVVLDYPTIKFVDYMSLLRIDGAWKIVNKSFNAQVKADVRRNTTGSQSR